MDGLLVPLFDGLVGLTVLMTSLAIGLEVTGAAMAGSARRRTFAVAVAINIVAVPLVALGLAELLALEGEVRLGFLLWAVCTGGPLGLKTSQLAGGEAAWTLSLTVVLLVSNVATLPVWSALLFGDAVTLRPGQVLGGMIVVVLFPVACGAAIRRFHEQRAATAAQGLIAISNVTLVAAVAVGVAAHLDEFASAMTAPALVAASLLLASSFALGWAISDSDRSRRSTALITLNRAASVALLVVGRGFGERAGVISLVIAFGALQTVVALGAALRLRRTAPVTIR